MAQDPEVPQFIQHPKKIDIFLFAALFGIAIYGFAMIPLRAYLLSHPVAYTLLVGGYTSAVVSGANASVGNGQWWVYLMCTIVGAAKFVPLYWAMGRRWGMEFIDMSVQYMPRMKKLFRRALGSESGTSTAITCALVPVSYCPGPIPGNVVNAVLGLLKVGPWAVLALNAASIAVINGVFMWLGMIFGDEVLEVVQVVNRYLLWITLGLIVVVIWRARRQTSRGNIGG